MDGAGADLAARCAAKDGRFAPVGTAADDVAMLAPTSGTTGQPKVTMHFHRDILATADTFSAAVIKPRQDDMFTGTPPLGCTFGLGGLLLFPHRIDGDAARLHRRRGRRHQARRDRPGRARLPRDDPGRRRVDRIRRQPVRRLAVQGPTGCRYLSGDRQRTYVERGWNITGDTYVRDADGYYWFQARSDDMIISSGYNIAGPEVEEALLGHPDVVEVAVVGAPDPGRGTVVQAFVVLREGAAQDPAKVAELQEFAKYSIAPYQYPRVVEFIAELPKTISGKTQRYRLRQLAEERLRAAPR